MIGVVAKAVGTWLTTVVVWVVVGRRGMPVVGVAVLAVVRIKTQRKFTADYSKAKQ